jgi:hypothetical protein
MAFSTLSPKEKLEKALDSLFPVLGSDNWYSRVFAREVLSPSPVFAPMIRVEVEPKIAVISAILSDLTQIPQGNPALVRCLLNLLSPFMILLIADKAAISQALPIFNQSKEELVEHMKRYALAGLNAIAQQYASNK